MTTPRHRRRQGRRQAAPGGLSRHWLRAFADHGRADPTLPAAGWANAILRRAREAGIDLDAVTAELEREGVRAFCDSYRELLDCIDAKAARAGGKRPPARSGSAR